MKDFITGIGYGALELFEMTLSLFCIKPSDSITVEEPATDRVYIPDPNFVEYDELPTINRES
jgi:hypothetical protein